MASLPDASVDVVYADPPFRAGVTRADPRDAATFYQDDPDLEKWLAMLRTFAAASRRVLKPSGSVFLHLDWHGVHEAKLLVMDEAFGKANFLGDLIWAYDWGARQKDRFSRKHDTILHYAKQADAHRFDPARVDRVPYKAPGLQMYRAKRLGKHDGAARVAAGKPVTDAFSDINVIGTAARERTLNSYPTMKPVKLVRRLLAPVVEPGCVVLDPLCGSGTALEAAASLSCSFVVGDANERAVAVARNRAKRLIVGFCDVER